MKNITKKLLNAQKAFPLIKKEDANPFFKSKYAGLPSVLEVVLPILQKQGLLLTQHPITSGERIGVKTVIMDEESGESIESEFTMTLAKNDPQGAGSAITYARRYALISILGLNVDDDDDGNVASGKPTPKVAYSPKVIIAPCSGGYYHPPKGGQVTINNVVEEIEL